MSRRRGFRVLLATVLGGLIVVWAAVQWDSYRLSSSLGELRDQRVLELQRHSRNVASAKERYEVVGTSNAGREYVLFGRPIGKVTVFARANSPMGGYRYGGVEYYYVMGDNSVWKFTDSIGLRDAHSLEHAESGFIMAGGS